MNQDAPILIVSALEDEQAGLTEVFNTYIKSPKNGHQCIRGKIQKKRAVALVTGVGENNAERTTKWAIQQFQPRAVLLAGYAGGLVPHVNWGEFVVDDESLAKLLNKPAHVGKIVCVPRVLKNRAEKSAVAAEFGAIACEMESNGVRRACQESALPFYHLRIISDSLDEELPIEHIEKIMDFEKGKVVPSRLVWHAVNHPGSIKTLMALGSRTLPLKTRLAEAISELTKNISLS